MSSEVHIAQGHVCNERKESEDTAFVTELINIAVSDFDTRISACYSRVLVTELVASEIQCIIWYDEFHLRDARVCRELSRRAFFFRSAPVPTQSHSPSPWDTSQSVLSDGFLYHPLQRTFKVIPLKLLFLPFVTKLRQGNVFPPVILSTWGGGVCLPQCMLGYTPPPLKQTATAADGTHPTGMHSFCYLLDTGLYFGQNPPILGRCRLFVTSITVHYSSLFEPYPFCHQKW